MTAALKLITEVRNPYNIRLYFLVEVQNNAIQLLIKICKIEMNMTELMFC